MARSFAPFSLQLQDNFMQALFEYRKFTLFEGLKSIDIVDEFSQ
jgi:hypothetical protein